MKLSKQDFKQKLINAIYERKRKERMKEVDIEEYTRIEKEAGRKRRSW